MNAQTKPCVLVTRASHQASNFIDACEDLGFSTTHLPCIEISPTNTAPDFTAIENYDLVLFTSVNAIEYAQQLQPLPWPVIATGIGTVSTGTLEALGQKVQQPVPPFTSEGFVEQLKNSNIKSLVIVKGDGGRTVIQDACEDLGIECTSIEVYQRIVPTYKESGVAALLTSNPPSVVCATSNEVLQNLITITPAPHKAQLLTLPLVVNSERSVKLARELGFTAEVVVADPPGDAGQLQALKSVLRR